MSIKLRTINFKCQVNGSVLNVYCLKCSQLLYSELKTVYSSQSMVLKCSTVVLQCSQSMIVLVFNSVLNQLCSSQVFSINYGFSTNGSSVVLNQWFKCGSQVFKINGSQVQVFSIYAFPILYVLIVFWMLYMLSQCYCYTSLSRWFSSVKLGCLTKWNHVWNEVMRAIMYCRACRQDRVPM